MPYRLSLGYNASDGIVETSWMRRANVGLNLSPSFFDDHLNLKINAKYMYEKDRYADAGGAIGSALSMDPTQPVYFDADDARAPFSMVIFNIRSHLKISMQNGNILIIPMLLRIL